MSGSDYTADSEGTARAWQAGVDAVAHMEGGTGAAAAGPTPGLAPPMPGSGAAGGETAAEGAAVDMDTQEDPGAGMPAEVPPPPPPPVEEPAEEELVGEKGAVREEMWAIVSVAMQVQGERSDELFGMMMEPIRI